MKQSAVEFLEKEITEIMSYLEEDGFYAMQGVKDKLFGEKNIIQQAKEIEEQQTEKVICKHCDKPISVNDINNHLFMNIKEGGLIHWNCETV